MKFYCSNYRLILAPPRFLSFSPVPIIYSPSLSRSQQAFFCVKQETKVKEPFLPTSLASNFFPPASLARVKTLSCLPVLLQNPFLPANLASKPFPSCCLASKPFPSCQSRFRTLSFLPISRQNPFLPSTVVSSQNPFLSVRFASKPFSSCHFHIKIHSNLQLYVKTLSFLLVSRQKTLF